MELLRSTAEETGAADGERLAQPLDAQQGLAGLEPQPGRHRRRLPKGVLVHRSPSLAAAQRSAAKCHSAKTLPPPTATAAGACSMQIVRP